MKSADELNGRFILVYGVKYPMFARDSFIFRFQKEAKETAPFCRSSFDYHCNTPRCKARILVHQYKKGAEWSFYVDSKNIHLSHNHKARKLQAKYKIWEAMSIQGCDLPLNALTPEEVFQVLSVPFGVPKGLQRYVESNVPNRRRTSTPIQPQDVEIEDFWDMDSGNWTLDFSDIESSSSGRSDNSGATAGSGESGGTAFQSWGESSSSSESESGGSDSSHSSYPESESSSSDFTSGSSNTTDTDESEYTLSTEATESGYWTDTDMSFEEDF